MVFQYNNICNNIPFYYYVKNELQILYVFMDAYDLHYIFIICKYWFFYGYIFYSLSTNILITPTY